MKNTKANKIWLGYSAALILFIITFSFTLTNSRNLLKYNKQVDASNSTIAKLEALVIQSKTTDKTLREYIFKKSDEILTRYATNMRETEDQLNQLLQQNSTDTVISFNSKLLIDTLKSYSNEASGAITSFERYNKIINDSVRKYTYNCLIIMDKFTTTLYDISKEKRKALDAQLTQISDSSQHIKNVNLILFCLAVFLSVYATFTYYREHKENRKKAATIQEYASEMETQVKDLAAANAELKLLRSNERFASIGRMAKTIAHEVRNPLTNINLAADQLQQLPGFNEGDKKILFDMMLRNSNRINDLISDLLSSTRFLELKLKEIHANELIEGALQLAADRIQLKKIKVSTHLLAQCNVMADKDKMLIALLNIIVNAIEAMNDKTNGILLISTLHNDTTCTIAIKDNGCGMSEEALTKLFDPYFTGKVKGMGLGLTNTQNIILAHKGFIEVNSKEGEGTTFTVTLPVV